MRFENTTPFEAGWTLGFAATGHELLVVVAKATYKLPTGVDDGIESVLAEVQRPLLDSDEFSGPPGTWIPRVENDYVTFKPRCDILLSGQAYAPHRRPISSVEVSLRVGNCEKSFVVTGSRVWESRFLRVTPGEPEPFVTQPFSYETAFGGTEVVADNPEKTFSFAENPVGCGFRCKDVAGLVGTAMPITHEIGEPVNHPKRRYRPMSFGPIGYHWMPRRQFAGSYDDEWLSTRAPFWPDDFDFQYFQGAPPDQQITYPQGGEIIEIHNLSPNGLIQTRVPKQQVPVLFIPHQGPAEEVVANLDTIYIEPDQHTMTLTWRVCRQLKKEIFELASTVVGGYGKRWLRERRARLAGKTYYRSLGEFVASRKSGGRS